MEMHLYYLIGFGSSTIQDVDVIITFPHDAKETTVLWYKKKIERIPGIILRTKTIVTSANKSANCYAFHLSATYKGWVVIENIFFIPDQIITMCFNTQFHVSRVLIGSSIWFCL